MSESARDRYTEMLQQGYDVDVIRQDLISTVVRQTPAWSKSRTSSSIMATLITHLLLR